MEEFDTVSNLSRFRDIYNFRWWNYSDKDNYFSMSNVGTTPIKPGDQVFYSYGSRSNSNLLLYYGFCLEEDNKCNSFEFRVFLNLNPKNPVPSPEAVLPLDSTKLYEDVNYAETTDLIALKPYRICDSFMSYLRSILQLNYKSE